jgi:HEAT repeat protein
MSSIIPFDSRQRLLEQARGYVDDPGRMLAERERAVPVLLRALKAADLEFRRKIILLLGSFAKEQACQPLYDIMKDPSEPDELRDQAAIHLCVLAPFLEDSQGLVLKLLNDIKSPDIDIRVRAIMALGWEGNLPAALPLIECLFDRNEEIQEVAVNALCNLKDSHVMALFEDRMRHGSLDQKRAILFNLWRFRDREDEVAAIYRRELEEGDSALRLDVLIVLGQITAQESNTPIYREFLQDPNPRIRALAIERLGELNALSQEEALSFLDDTDMEVKRAALDIIQNTGADRHQP